MSDRFQPHITDGLPYPRGARLTPHGSYNFSLAAPDATGVFLCLFGNPGDRSEETHRIPLINRQPDIWHVEVGGIPEGTEYGYRIMGPWDPVKGLFVNEQKLILDPYATVLASPTSYHPSLRTSLVETPLQPCRIDSALHAPRGVLAEHSRAYYDWEGDQPLYRPMNESSICELHVKGYTQLHPDVPEHLRGTYAGLASPCVTDYLNDLGITAVQLLPVHQHMEDGFLLERGLKNYWGYNTLAFFAPERAYCATDDPVREFRDMVKAFHRAGIEVILDVVYNHTCEAGIDGPTCLFRGLGNRAYYHHDPRAPGNYVDYTGCGNSVDVSGALGVQLAVDSLRYWVEEMHVDGFRFDLAVELGRNRQGYSPEAAFFQAIYQDPVLQRTKLIAEPWDLGLGGYQVGNFPTRWFELNGKFRDTSRRFWKGDQGVAGDLAKRLTGSEELFAHNRRTPAHSVNLITSHDGFTLYDLVCYNEKHNLDNGEKNRDGDSHNLSWNHGVEGPTDDPDIHALRLRQVRNFLLTTILSQGVPFLTAGDERLRSQGGNNNAYCQDSPISWISWEHTDDSAAIHAWTKKLFAFAREHEGLRRTRFFTGKPHGKNGLPDVHWLSRDSLPMTSSDWQSEKASAFVMLLNCDSAKPVECPLLFFFNASAQTVRFDFPKTPFRRWSRVLDTADPELQLHSEVSPVVANLIARSCQVWSAEC